MRHRSLRTCPACAAVSVRGFWSAGETVRAVVQMSSAVWLSERLAEEMLR